MNKRFHSDDDANHNHEILSDEWHVFDTFEDMWSQLPKSDSTAYLYNELLTLEKKNIIQSGVFEKVKEYLDLHLDTESLEEEINLWVNFIRRNNYWYDRRYD